MATIKNKIQSILFKNNVTTINVTTEVDDICGKYTILLRIKLILNKLETITC